MKKKNFRAARFAALWLAATLLAALLAGCGAGPAASEDVSGPSAPAGGQQAAAGLPDDGVLRCHSASRTVFSGARPIYTAGPHELVRLLTDTADGEANYFQVGTPQGSDQYLTTVRDNTGAVVLDLGSKALGGYCGGWVLTYQEPDWYSGETEEINLTDCAMTDLATGRTVPLPDGANNLALLQPGLLAVGVRWWQDRDTLPQTYLELYDLQGNLLQTVDDCSIGYQNGQPLPEGWAVLERPGGQVLYEIATGRMVGPYMALYNRGQAWVEQEEDGFALVDLASGETLRTALDAQEREIAPGLLLRAASHETKTRGGDWLDYELVEPNGTVTAVDYAYSYQKEELYALRSAETIRLYADGELVFEKPYDRILAEEGQDLYYSMWIDPPSRQVLLNCTLYGGQGDEWTWSSTGQMFAAGEGGWPAPLEGYSNLYRPEGADYLCASYLSDDGRVTLYDILGTDGAVLVHGVRDVRECYPSFFACRRGFAQGWMDLEGNWLWSESVWADTDEEANGFYW